MNVNRRRLAALAATVSSLAFAVPATTASAQLPALPTLPTTPLPAFNPVGLSFVAPTVHIATVLGPTIIGSVVMEGPGAAGQVAAGAPQAISLLSNSGLTGAASPLP
jgi:hypothetical protein